MLPRDWDGGDDADAREYLTELKAWLDTQAQLVQAQADARTALDLAGTRVGVLSDWSNRLHQQLGSLGRDRAAYDTDTAALAATNTDLAATEGQLADVEQAYAVATARLLGDIGTTAPILLLPLRLEVHWTSTELLVRIYPDDIGVNAHDPRLTAAETAAGQAYWTAVHGLTAGDTAGAAQAWETLVRRTGAPRAAWIARVCDPAHPLRPGGRATPWDTVGQVSLLPDRFAVVAIGDQLPRDIGGTGRYVTWGAPVTARLDVPAVPDPTAATWLTDFAVAEANGLAVRIPIAAGTTSIDALLAVGVRSSTPATAISDLLGAHAVSQGLAVLADGTPTNNSDTVRAGMGKDTQSDAARSLLAGGAVPAGSAGAQLATILGLDPAALGGVLGSSAARGPAQAAMSTLLAAGTVGALSDTLPDTAWPTVVPTGPAPTLRIGHQPYGVLPASAPGRWTGQAGQAAAPLTDVLHTWAAANGPQLSVDPGSPPAPPVGGTARSLGTDGIAALPAITVENPQSTSWRAGATTADLVGSGAAGPATYLTAIANTQPSGLTALAGQYPALLAQAAIAAKQHDGTSSVDAALHTLAASVQSEADLPALAALFSSGLDARSHRIDAWLTGAFTERLLAQRAAPGHPSAVGAYGWLTDLAPAARDRSEGYLLAPSLGHGATAAVLRSGYLAERAAAGPGADTNRVPLAVDLSSARVRSAQHTLAAVRAGQPLAAVLGRSVEQDLADSGLQRYLSALRKLTRFRAGTALEADEDARDQAAAALAAAERQLAALQATAAHLAELAIAADAAAAAAAGRQAGLEGGSAAPYLAKQVRRDHLRDTDIPTLTAALAAIDAQRPVVGVHHHTLTVPVP
jgi:hypothetical protein